MPPALVRNEPLGREFTKLWTSHTVSNLGDGVRFAAFPLLAASLTNDPARVSGLYVVLAIPAVLFGLQAGALVDRLDRRRVLGLVNLAQAGVIAVLAAAVALDGGGLVLLYAVAFLVGTAETFVDNAAVTVLPDLVPVERLETANGRLEAAHIAANDFAGALLGAALFAIAAPAAFAGDAALTVVAALLALSLRGVPPPSTRAAPTTIRRDVAEGLRFSLRHPQLRALLGLVVVVAAADMAWFGVLVLYATVELGFAEVGFGLLLAAGAAGAITGGLVTDRLSRRLGTARTAGLALALEVVTLALLASTSSPPVAVAALAANGLAFGTFNVVSLSLRQRVTPAPLLGRVNGTYRFLAFGATAAGAAAGGLLAQVAGLRAPFAAGALLFALCTPVAVAVLSRAGATAGGSAARSGDLDVDDEA